MKRKALTLCLGVLLTLSLSACQEGYHLGHFHESDNNVTVEQPPEGDDSSTGESGEGGDVHTHEYTDTVVDPTCTEDGYTIHTCECGETYTDTYVSALGHDVTEWTSVDEENHSGTCTRCGDTITEGHTYDDGVVTEPTCGEGGYTTYTCEGCGYSYEDDQTDPTGVHTWSDWVPDVDETTGEDAGTHTRTCSVCGTTETEAHYVYETTHEDGKHISKCICGAEYEVIEDATYYSVTSENVHTEKCSVCDYEGTDEAHSYTGQNCSICGFSTGLEYWGYDSTTEEDCNTDPDSYRVYSEGTYTGKELVLPNSYNNLPVIATYGGGSFASSNGGPTEYTYVSIPASIEVIGDYDFANFNSLETLVFESGSQLETIEDQAFVIMDAYMDEGDALTDVTIPASVKEIGEYAFHGRSGLETITFEEGSQLETLGMQAFCYCYSLKELTIPSSVTSIGDRAFFLCYALETLTFEDGINLEKIGDQTFCSCYELTEVTIPASVKTISYNAFYDCLSLESLTFEEGSQLETIGYQAFCDCASLTSLTIPNTVTSIGDLAFLDCESLEELILEEDSSLETIGEAAFDCLAVTTLSIPASVESISAYAFGDSDTVVSIVVEGSEDGTSQLTTLGAAFAYDTALETITLPGSIQTIEGYDYSIGSYELTDYIFDGCESLTTINFYGSEDLWNSYNGVGTLPSGATVNYLAN